MSGQRVDAKVMMLGENSVGKTSLVERYVRRHYNAPYHFTVGASFDAKAINLGSRNVTLGIWDTAGSEGFDSVTRMYYRGSQAAIVCYDVTDHSSLQKMKFWVNELQNVQEHCRIYICGTKSDLVEFDNSMRQVDFHDVQEYADEIKAHLCETSSKTGQNVDELFQKVAEDYVNYSDSQVQTEPKGEDLNSRRDSTSNSCCLH